MPTRVTDLPLSDDPEQGDDFHHRAEVLERILLHGELATAWPVSVSLTTKPIAESLIEGWQAVCLPDCCNAG